jgi:coiled-coil domain-containing protein 39
MSDSGKSFQPYMPENDFPEYANDENKNLNSEIKEKKEFISRFGEEIEEIGERVKILSEHFKSVQEELVHTQVLVTTETKQIEGEDHLKQLAERQIGRIYSELQRIEIQAGDQQDRLNSIQNEIFKGNEKLDQFKLEMNWNQEELEQWALASRQKEDDNLTLEKYKLADDAKIKELTLHIERITMEVRQKQSELDKEVTETQAKQIELDKTAEEFKRNHTERHELYERLQETIKACKRLDKQFSDSLEQFKQDRLRIRKKEETLAQRVKAYENLKGESQKIQSQNTLEQRKVADQRMEEIKTKQDLETFKAEVDITRNQLSALASDLNAKRAQILALNKELAQRKQRFEEALKKEEQTRLRLESEYKQTENLESNAKGAEEIFKKYEGIRNKIEKEIRDLKDSLFKETKTLLELRSDEANLLGEIKGALAAGRNLQAAINKRDQEIQKQHVLLYSADYLIQSNERKVDEAKGIQITDKNKELIVRIEENEKKFAKKEEQLEKVTKSVKELGDDLRLIEKNLDKTLNESNFLKNNYEELNLQIKMIDQEITKGAQHKNDILVQHDTMKLEIKKLKDILCSEADKLFAVENRKYQLQMSMEEREKEINVHKETLLAEKRAAEEEKHKVLVELSDRKCKVQNLKVKYENLCYKNRSNDDDGEERTQAYYVIKAAQEREELQRYGDELDSKIKKAEREIACLSDTLDHLKGRNTRFRDSYLTNGNTNEVEMKNSIEDQCRAATEQLSKKEKELRTLQRQYEEDMKHLLEVQTKQEALSRIINDSESVKLKTRQQISQQQDKIKRAIQSYEAAEVDLNRVQELDLGYQLAKTKNKCLMSALSQLNVDVPELANLIDNVLTQNGIKLPSRPPSSLSNSSRGSFK